MADKLNSLKLLVIADYNTKKIIGTYKSDTDARNAENKELLHKISNILEGLNNFNNKNKVYFNNYSIYYTVSKDNIFYSAAVLYNKTSNSLFDENQIYEIFEEINNQNVYKFQDKQGELNNVGKQNLQYIIDRFMENNNKDDNKKIISINADLSDMQSSMKGNIRKMMTNLDSVNELDSKAGRIQDNSLLFKNDAENLRKTLQYRNMRMKIIVGVVLAGIIGFVVYKIAF